MNDAIIMRRPDRSTAASWPFWLLIAAWFCANVPSATTLQAVMWLKGARHFSHQGELRREVAALLSGRPQKTHPLLATPASGPRSLPPVLPASVETKKTDLALTTGHPRVIASMPAVARPGLVINAPAEPVAEVPHPPPRPGGPA